MENVVSAGFRTSPQQRHAWAAAPQWSQLLAWLDGPLDAGRLAAAVESAAVRHEILRTRVGPVAGYGGPVQVIEDEPPGLAAVHDLTGAADPDLDEVLNRECELREDGAGVRVALVRQAERRCALVLSAPATIADRQSLRLLLAEIARAYHDGDGVCPEVRVQYADYAAWHNDLLDDRDRVARRSYWDGHVDPALSSGADPILEPAGDPGPWRTTRVWLDSPAPGAALGAGLGAALGAQEDVVVASAWAVLLWRLCGERDLALSATLPGRSYQELDAAIGPFARDVPVVAIFDGGQPFRAVVAMVGKALSDATEHADDLDPGRLDPAFVRSAPGFEWVSAAPATGTDVVFRVHRESVRRGSPLVLRAGRDAGGCWLELAHDSRRLDAERADELLARLRVLLAGVAAEPDTPVGATDLLLAGERERLLAAAHGPGSPVAHGFPVTHGSPVTESSATVHGLVAGQARRTPDAVALDDGVSRLTYAELHERSDRLARHLAARGVTPGARVVLLMRRSPEFVVSLLAVLRTGAAYVPVDVRQPGQRLAFLVGDTAAPVVLAGHGAEVPPDLPVPVLRYEMLDAAPAVDAVLPEKGCGADLAYVMYTSGSTGVPNGVPVTHAALLNYLLWAAEAYDLRAGTGSLVHSSIGFDLTVTGLLGPLLVGQRVLLVPESEGLAGLVSALRSAAGDGAHDLGLLKLTPSHLSALAQLMDPAELAGTVRTLVIGGEQLHAEALEPFRAAGTMRIVNEYGPTETVVGSSAYVVDGDTPHAGPVPIGRPIGGTRIHLLDTAMRPVPDGVAGEVYIGGAGVSGGYVGRDELTGQRFVPDPFTASNGSAGNGSAGNGSASQRLYRTGDRARRDRNGNLVYLGRVDDQLKVRGFRVEPGEIEAALREHPKVARAAVVLSITAQSERLAACVVPADPGDVPTVAQLHSFCEQRLPDYLVPAVFVTAAELPTTPNGKLDRAAVRTLIDGEPAAAPYAPPRTETEEILSGAVAAVLGRERVGIDDNYFVIGGDSIRSVMVASRAQARGLPVSVADLHRHPTIRELAHALVRGGTAEPEVHTEPFALVGAEDRALLPDEVEDAFPLNLLQEGMIFHRDFAAKSAVYHAIASVRLKAPLDLELMRRVLHELVVRHPMLRTSFDQTTYSRPLQLVHSVFKDPLSYEDLTGLDELEQEARVASWVDSEKARGFELDEHPLIRFMVQKLDEDSFQFTYGFHHEIVDGWSEALMVTEIFDHYFSVIFDEPIAMQTPRSTMRDAIALELEALGRKENYEFWTRYLADATLMRLPRLNSGPSADKGAREIVRIPSEVSEELSDALKKLATENAVPLKSVLLAAHMAVMNLYHGQQDTLTYTVTNGRPESADGSTAIGLFVNSLALRVRMAGGTWLDLVERTLDSERQSMPYRRLPMAELKRHQGNEPLAETLFFFTDYHVFHSLERWRAYGIEHMASELYGESTFPFCAIFRLNRETSHLEVRIEYDSLQFPADLMDDIAETYSRVLQTIVADPQAHYERLSLLSDAERHRVLVEWNSSGPALEDAQRIHDVIGDWARRTPDAIALSDGDRVLSYAALDARAARVASALVELGAGPETTVGLLVERGLETVICLLGILKAGAAYLPLDPSSPDERLAAIVRGAAPVVVLASPEHVDRVQGVRMVAIEPGLAFARQATRRPLPAPGADGAAYVIYTSGSTGEPKGVVVSHRALVNSTLARAAVYRQRPERFLLLSALVFDSSVAGLFWPLCTGGTLVLPPEGIQLEPAALARHIEERAVTHTLAVPSLLTALLDQGEPQRLRSLRAVIAAGEASSRELWDDVATAMPGATFHNEYGPTESTVWSTVWSGRPIPHRPQLPIGRPVPGVRTYVLNWNAHPVPIGVPGELYLGGAGLARGYLGRPGFTAASFLPDPFSTEPGARMYRTGDLAWHTQGGELEFLGRTDNQVKIRGFRVELGEVEGVLDAHPDVHRSVVLARDDQVAGEKVLVAYVALNPGTAAGSGPTPAQLQKFVRDRLPRYMVPATCVVLDALPLAATGKIDRASLPAPLAFGGRPDVELVAPRTETEQLLADIWRQALGRDELGVEDEFFEIGGESLRAMQVVTRTNKVFGLDLSVRSLFDAPTVASFAVTVDEARVAERV